MQPSLNLLSPTDKKKLRQMHLLLSLYEAVLSTFIMIAIGSAMMFFARTTLEDKFQEVTLSETPGSSKFATLNRDIHTINIALTRLEQSIQTVHYWSPRIAQIATHTPPGIRFNSFEIGEDGKTTIQAVARTRNDLTAFRDALSTSPSITRINLPLQYFVEKEQVEFIIELLFEPSLTTTK
ncbi:MAG: hypothetical protein Q7S48_01630 [bacterium]|nr:hypothetical protein [bacterium]